MRSDANFGILTPAHNQSPQPAFWVKYDEGEKIESECPIKSHLLLTPSEREQKQDLSNEQYEYLLAHHEDDEEGRQYLLQNKDNWPS